MYTGLPDPTLPCLTGILPHKRLQPRHLYYQYQLAALALKNAEGELKVALNAQECKLLKVCPSSTR